MISRQDISANFSTAKVLAIFAVVLAHFFPLTLLWIPAQVALFVFAFSSGYYTTGKYSDNMDVRAFWIAKLPRLLLPVLVVDLFLLGLFLVEGRNGILSAHTPLAAVGLSGIYDWLGIENRSPFGMGLWFFTVLILFYLAFPLLLRFMRAGGLVALVACACVCLAGVLWAAPPYALWPTVFGFCFGVYEGLTPDRGPDARRVMLTGLAVVILGLSLNALGLKQANLILIPALSIASVQALRSWPLPGWLLVATRPLGDCVLEIYLLHTYLFLPRQTLGTPLSLAASLLLIFVAAVVLHTLTTRLSNALFGGTSRARAHS